ncbi:hypothetical protein GCM10010975_26110 [Comamonas phosphati]|nr:hypothetical protein GCM10010975_26110 [Comamonas phosphati]
MFRAPSQANLPHISHLLNDIPGNVNQVAKHLGISATTLRKYKAQGQAPRAVMLALFWESTWGRMTADTVAFNHAAAHAAQAAALKRQRKALLRQIQQLESEIANQEGRAANSPVFRIG